MCAVVETFVRVVEQGCKHNFAMINALAWSSSIMMTGLREFSACVALDNVQRRRTSLSF